MIVIVNAISIVATIKILYFVSFPTAIYVQVNRYLETKCAQEEHKGSPDAWQRTRGVCIGVLLAISLAKQWYLEILAQACNASSCRICQKRPFAECPRLSTLDTSSQRQHRSPQRPSGSLRSGPDSLGRLGGSTPGGGRSARNSKLHIAGPFATTRDLPHEQVQNEIRSLRD